MKLPSLKKMAKLRSFVFLQITVTLIWWTACVEVQCKDLQAKSRQARQLQKLNKYDIVTPHRLDGRHRREASTLTQDGHMTEASFVLPAFGKEYVLDVRLNEKLIPNSYVETFYTDNGDLVTRKPHKHHHCYYHGAVREANTSLVAISTCRGLMGMVNVDGENLNVEPLEESPNQHVVYWDKDYITDGQKYVMDSVGDVESFQKLLETTSRQRTRRDILSETKYVELVLVNDYEEFASLRNGILTATQERSKLLANMMDANYRALNIRIALVAVEVWTSGQQIDITHDPAHNLERFQVWRSENLSPRIYNDNAQLITGVPFQDSIVGMGHFGQMCTTDKSCGVNTDIELVLARQALTITHEMGHNFGLPHNKDGCDCPEHACIMDSLLGDPAPTSFSSCSVSQMEAILRKGFGVCLLDYPKEFFGGPVCGNHFLEQGEDCDCGTPEECNTPCCIPGLCRFHTNATCADGECCENCQMKPAGILCRDVFNECDLPEFCTGNSAECPGNVYRQNGLKCANDPSSHCFGGQCRSFQRQCEDIWGTGIGVQAGIDECYEYNKQGSHFGSCGVTDERPCPTRQVVPTDPCYKRCEEENVKCGRLMCENLPSRPVLSAIAQIASADAYDSRGYHHICKSAQLNFGDHVPDMGYVAEGSICGEGKVCLNFKCQNISNAGVRPCPYNCFNHGVCNSNNHCHCDRGWAPPKCDTPGYGGSIDSGPALQPGEVGVSSGTIAGLLVLFLVIFPLLTCIGILIYCKRQKVRQMINKSRERGSVSRHSFKNERPASNGASRKNVGRSPSLRTSPPTIQHIPNEGTGSVTHDVYPLIATNPEVAYKPDSRKGPPRPISPPPDRPSQPPPFRPTAPPMRPPVPQLKPTARSSSFKSPATLEETPSEKQSTSYRNNKPPTPPFKLAPPPKSPPPVQSPPPTNEFSAARVALKPVPRPRPSNVNTNNSKNDDWTKGGDLITAEPSEETSFIAKKPSITKKPSVSRKPPVRPSCPPLRTPSMKDSVTH